MACLTYWYNCLACKHGDMFSRKDDHSVCGKCGSKNIEGYTEHDEANDHHPDPEPEYEYEEEDGED